MLMQRRPTCYLGCWVLFARPADALCAACRACMLMHAPLQHQMLALGEHGHFESVRHVSLNSEQASTGPLCNLLHSPSGLLQSWLTLLHTPLDTWCSSTDVRVCFQCNYMRIGVFIALLAFHQLPQLKWIVARLCKVAAGGSKGRGAVHTSRSMYRMSRRRCRVTQADAVGWHAVPRGVWRHNLHRADTQGTQQSSGLQHTPEHTRPSHPITLPRLSYKRTAYTACTPCRTASLPACSSYLAPGRLL